MSTPTAGPRPPRLVATDLDGTIVRGDRTVSARTVAALTRVERAGALFVLVTGRPPSLMGDIAGAFGHRGVAICSNGALGYDLRTRTVVAERPIPADVLGETARLLRATAPGIGLAVEYADELVADERYESRPWSDTDPPLRRLDDARLFGRPAPKLVGRHPTLSADALLALLRPVVGELVTLYHSNGERLIEAVARGVSKAAALDELARRHGIAREQTIAFGDMPNDLPMLAWAGTSYAVANAHPEVLATADRVIGGNDEDGVAEVLERLFRQP
ncbi:HAD family hydrolase [Streptomyces rubellomurinus]|uniref:Hydrolase n=2 Tax=Streptomyces TaxID=1883 RepID=A0A0F2TGN9_STRR3|nr:Cof-type HAD-IIB family hydrolase [Streptomyces rubellomurinus]KJS54191.1 hydrolase [Streptomyces rubellomurinus subsp. indigoferus]KJS61711.1 hydrolase [Streptomyces rubellomurinus]